VGALSDPKVGEFLSEHFVAAYEQIGGFRSVNVNGRVQRNGGNVASYFCTPDGRVIHAVTGPVNARTLLAEGQRALEMYQAAEESPWQRVEVIRTAHRRAAGSTNGRQQQVHQLLARRPLPVINDVQREIFGEILGEEVRDDESYLGLALHAYRTAYENDQPVLLILHRNSDNTRARDRWRSILYDAQGDLRVSNRRQRDAMERRQNAQTLLALARRYVVVGLPINELPALSEHLGIEPYSASSSGSTLLVVTKSDGRQVDSLSGWPSRSRLSRVLMRGLIDQAKETEASPAELRQLLQVARNIDDAVTLQVRDLLQEAIDRRRG
jgi:hypothetical protein